MKFGIISRPQYQNTDRADRLNQKSVSRRSTVVSDRPQDIKWVL
ncbi:hypothetical protein QUA56_05230 [Microcoleus sp. N3A4]